MQWTIAAPFFTAATDRWIDNFVPTRSDEFRKVVPSRRSDWHARVSRATPIKEWRRHWRQSHAALTDTDGVVTVFPQLALTTAIQRDVGRRRVPIVAWCFNIGRFPTGLKGKAAKLALERIDRFVVHSTSEVEIICAWLGLGNDRVQYVPLQVAPIPLLEAEDEVEPFIVSMGSANRDYSTLFEAARRTRLPLTVVAARRAVEGLAVPSNVTLLSGLDRSACWRIAQRARFSIVPLDDIEAASGQVTVIESMRMSRPVIATRSAGTVDYIEDGTNGFLVPPRDPVQLADAIMRLWDDTSTRYRVADRAAVIAAERYSDEAAGEALARILAEIMTERD